MNNNKIRITVYVLALLPLLTFLALYQVLPEQMPAHWNLDGTVRYDSKNSFFLFTGMSIIFAVMFDFLPKIDPRRKNYQKFGKYYDGFCLFMMFFLIGMCAVIFTEALRPGTLPVERFVVAMVALLFLVIGNMLPTVKSNFYMGIRTPWALSDNEVWNKSNRLGGHLMFGAGVILLIGNFILPSKILYYIMLILVGIIVVLPTVMSYIWYQKRKRPL